MKISNFDRTWAASRVGTAALLGASNPRGYGSGGLQIPPPASRRGRLRGRSRLGRSGGQVNDAMPLIALPSGASVRSARRFSKITTK